MLLPPVLIVDDNPGNLHVVGVLLRPLPAQRVAKARAHARQLAHRAPLPDLIRLDGMVPGLDGVAVLRLQDTLQRRQAGRLAAQASTLPASAASLRRAREITRSRPAHRDGRGGAVPIDAFVDVCNARPTTVQRHG